MIRLLEWIASIIAIFGTLSFALYGAEQDARFFGFVAYLICNILFLVVYWKKKLYGAFAMTCIFVATSIIGIIRDFPI